MRKSERIIKIVNEYYNKGKDKPYICNKYNIKFDTLNRYVRYYNEINKSENNNNEIKTVVEVKPQLSKEDIQKNKIFNELCDKYSISELQYIAKGYDPTIHSNNKIKLNFNGNKIKFCLISDTHIGSKYFVEQWWDSMLEKCEKEKVDFICHTGDLVEGLSDRKGHWYDLTHIGYTEQKKYAVELLKRSNIKIYGIDGNHDRWYIKSANALICKDIENEVANYKYLGSDEGDIYLNKNVSIKLWHGEDGNSYATSYRIQKLIESFSVRETPNILLLGHVHKAAYLPSERDVFAFSAGAMCKQSAWMRSKKLANHSGFWIIDATYNNTEVISCKGEFFQLK